MQRTMRNLAPILLAAACSGSEPGTSSTTTGITTVAPGGSTGSSGSTSSSSSGGEGSGSSTSSAPDTSTSSAPPDLPEFETLGPAKGCGKIDILFSINDDGGLPVPKYDEDSALSAKKVRDAANTFMVAMQEQAADYDLRVMVVKGDPDWRSLEAAEYCCSDDLLCDELGPYPCEFNEGLDTACDWELGAGVRYPLGFMASNRDCELAGGHRYLTEAQDDFGAAFDCIINVGRTGRPGQRYMGAMVRAVGPTLTGEGGCNEGFLRPDAMLVVVVISKTLDMKTPGTPEGWAASLIAAKVGYTEGIVVVSAIPSVEHPNDGWCLDTPDDRVRRFVELFPNHVLGSWCAPDIGVYFAQAVTVIEQACAEFIPPG